MRLISLFILCSLCTISCKKEVVNCNSEISQVSNGAIVLNEGLFQYNNSSVSFIDFSNGNVSNSFFYDQNGRSLGDTGNDMIKYGNKIYISVSVSSTIEVLNAQNFKSVKQIQMLNGTSSKQPRQLLAYNGKVFVTCFDGYVDVLDTVNLTVENRIQVGSNPESMGVSNGKLFVSNSGGLNNPMDSTVSVVDLSTFQEIKKITVGLNPGDIYVDNMENIFVISRGDYSIVPSRLKKINGTNNELIQSFSFDAGGLEGFNSKILISYYDYNTQQNKISLFNPASGLVEIEDFVELSTIQTLYGCQYNPINDHIYVFDANGFTISGEVHEFLSDGTFLQSTTVGINPTKIVFYE